MNTITLSSEALKAFLVSCTVFGTLFVAFIAILWFLWGIGICNLSFSFEGNAPWGAFIPFYRNSTVAEVAGICRRKDNANALKWILPVLSVAMALLCFIGVILEIHAGVNLLFRADIAISNGKTLTAADFRGVLNSTFPFWIAGCLAVIIRFFRLVCLYRICKVFAPNKAILYVILVILIPLLEGVIYYSVCRNTPVFDQGTGDSAYFQ
ncbi:MAG: hypothetical protein IKI29_01385 [Clostridia bacterium]|nr:hypothetical protein [Clostridia bacterium]